MIKNKVKQKNSKLVLGKFSVHKCVNNCRNTLNFNLFEIGTLFLPIAIFIDLTKI